MYLFFYTVSKNFYMICKIHKSLNSLTFLTLDKGEIKPIFHNRKYSLNKRAILICTKSGKNKG